jgi:hypothetical protein
MPPHRVPTSPVALNDATAVTDDVCTWNWQGSWQLAGAALRRTPWLGGGSGAGWGRVNGMGPGSGAGWSRVDGMGQGRGGECAMVDCCGI